MCKCDPKIRTPFCGQGDCVPPDGPTNRITKCVDEATRQLRAGKKVWDVMNELEKRLLGGV